MKLRQMIPQRKLRATAVRRAPSRAAVEEDEPTMRLSSAFVVVVLLHLVAIGGIVTFEKVKVHRASPARAEAATSETAVAPAQAPKAAPAPVAARENASATHAPAHATAAAPKEPGIRDSGEIHVVVKGENPVAIAKKHGIDYGDLLQLNKIEDPTKLQIGQKLHLPVKSGHGH